MRGITARLGKGFFDPVASPTKESLRALLWNLQSRGFPSPCTLDRDDEHMRPPASVRHPSKGAFALPWNPPTADCSGHNQRAFMPLGTQTKEPSCPLETRPGIANPGPPAGISRLLPTKAVPWNPSLEEGGWRQEVTNGNGTASLRSV